MVQQKKIDCYGINDEEEDSSSEEETNEEKEVIYDTENCEEVDALNDDVTNDDYDDEDEMDDNDDDLVGLDTVYILLLYDTNKIGLHHCSNDGVDDDLRQYGHWENYRCEICGHCVSNNISMYFFE